MRYWQSTFYRYRPRQMLPVCGDVANLPQVIICQHQNDADIIALCRRLGRRALIAGTADGRHNAGYIGDLGIAGMREILRQSAQTKWAIFVQLPPIGGDNLAKICSEAVLMAAKLGGGTVAVTRFAYDGSWHRCRTLFVGAPFVLLSKNGRAAVRQTIDEMERCTAIVTDDNIARAFLRWGNIHGWARPLLTEFGRVPLSYRQLYRAAWALGAMIDSAHASKTCRIGIMLPSSVAATVIFYAAVMRGFTPVILNPTTGRRGLLAACETAGINIIYTSQKLLQQVTAAQDAADLLQQSGVRIVLLEELRQKITLRVKMGAFFSALVPAISIKKLRGAQYAHNHEAVILFTSGSSGTPKGVALSHGNLLSNAAQVLARLDGLSGEKMLNSLPVFHAFGLLAGVVLPAAGGMLALQYPSPLHYRTIPDIIRRFGATIFFSADSFLAAYAREAHPMDMRSLRYVFAGAEKLKESTRQHWARKFGVRILEGYGVSEASPVIAVNAPGENRPGTVGRPLAYLQTRMLPAADMPGEMLSIRGANIMLGYLHADGILSPPDGWYDTGDIVKIDAEGFLTIQGRARRFIKISGEMTPLDGIETELQQQWPQSCFATTGVGDAKRGEQIAAITDNPNITRKQIIDAFQRAGLPPLWVPRYLIVVNDIPQLSTGKTDYPAVQKIANAEIS